jgi:hypothetical protein
MSGRDIGVRDGGMLRRCAFTALAAMFAAFMTLAFGAGVVFATSTTAATYYEDSQENLCVGFGTPFPAGDCEMKSLTTGFANVGIGFGVLSSDTNGHHNVASGYIALQANTEGGGNTANGSGALRNNTTGSDNTGIGNGALPSNTTGARNLGIGGVEPGANLTTGSDNVDISNRGVAGEGNTTRIGTEGTQTRAFLAGVYNKIVTAPSCAVVVNSAGQLGCGEGGGDETAVANFIGKKEVLNGKCLAYTDIGGKNAGTCPAQTTANGYASSTLLAGPTTASGAKVTDLFATTTANVAGTDTVVVEVIDNTAATVLLTCTITAGNHCSNTGSSTPVVAGHYLEVELTINGASGSAKQWRVTFRY